MADPTLRIEAAGSFQEPETEKGSVRAKDRTRPQKKITTPQPLDLAADEELGENDEHKLDTVA